MEKHTAEFEICGILTHNGISYTGTDQVGKLCRVLKEGVLEIYRDGRLSMTIHNVQKRSEKSLTENGTGLQYIKYNPFPVHVFSGDAS